MTQICALAKRITHSGYGLALRLPPPPAAAAAAAAIVVVIVQLLRDGVHRPHGPEGAAAHVPYIIFTQKNCHLVFHIPHALALVPAAATTVTSAQPCHTWWLISASQRHDSV